MASILDKIRKASVIKEAALVSESDYFKPEEAIDTGIYALNLILTGKPYEGITPGFCMIAAPRAHFKTLLALRMVAAFQEKYPDGAVIFYDSEHGGSLDYMKSMGVDPTRVLHTPIASIEELKFDMTAQLKNLEKDDRVMFFIDSLGMLASKKEADDALAMKTAVDMTKAKELASFVRLVTPEIGKKRLYCVGINHVYKDIGNMYGGNINAGGEKLQYGANTIIHIGKTREKDGKDLLGFTFKLIANKSRFVREGTEIPLVVTFENGVNKCSGLFDLALRTGWLIAPKQGWYMPVNKTTGEELSQANVRRKDLENDEAFWEDLFKKGFADDLYKTLSTSGTGRILTLDGDSNFERVNLADDTDEGGDE